MARILLVEDDTALCDFVRMGLETDGHEVTAVHNGDDALSQITSEPEAYDLLLTDIQVPGRDGIALAIEIRQDHPNLPILLMTGMAEERERAEKQGSIIQGVIQKPFTLEQIRAEVTAAITTN